MMRKKLAGGKPASKLWFKIAHIPAFAKINWSLRVSRQRRRLPRNRHGTADCQSHDTLTLEETTTTSYGLVRRSVVPADKTNLVWRAAAALRELYSLRRD